MLDSTTKRCTKCGEEKPATPEYFFRSSVSKSGLCFSCKVCDKIYSDQYNRAKGHKPKNYGLVENGNRRCIKCHEWKPDTLEHYYADKSKPSGKNPVCKACNNKRKQEWRLNNPDKVKEGSRRQRQRTTPEQRVKDNAYQLARYHANPQAASNRYKKYYKRKRDYHLERGKKYKSANPDKVRANEQRRRTREHQLPNTLTASEWHHALGFFNCACAYCGNQQGFWNRIEVEHFVPVTAPNCPGSTKDNILPACRHCNSSKNNRDAAKWLTWKFGKRKALAILKRINEYFDSVRSE